MFLMVAVVHENNIPVRAFKGDGCISKAHRWAHNHYALADFSLNITHLPDFLKVTFHVMTDTDFNKLVGIHEEAGERN